jgi:hypothetical protein
MKVTIQQKTVRVPQVIPIGIDTLRVPMKVYNKMLGVHPSINHPGGGIWSVSWAPTGQLVVELPSEKEAECFVLELLKDVELGKVLARVQDREQTVDVSALTRFVTFWGERRKLALPKYLAKTHIPEGVIITGWNERGDK